MITSWMIYGANGYTGELIARQAAREGLTPILAGRNAEAVERLSQELGLDNRVFSLENAEQVAEHLADVDLILHCAGPFSQTSRVMVEACLTSGTHYLDITGEIDVFEMIHAKDISLRAKERGIVLCPGVGFDVIPTDCTALKLKELLPDATQLSLGFSAAAGISPGTTKTMIRGLSSGSAERRNGKIVSFPMGSKTREIDFGKGPRTTAAIPWGDVSTAYYTTGIPSISTWIPMNQSSMRGAKFLKWLGPILQSAPVQKGLLRWVDRSVKGPDENTRTKTSSYIWGEAKTADGRVQTVRIQTANGYELTIHGSLEVVKRMMNQERFPSGSFTPAMLFGSSLVESLPGSGTFEIVPSSPLDK